MKKSKLFLLLGFCITAMFGMGFKDTNLNSTAVETIYPTHIKALANEETTSESSEEETEVTSETSEEETAEETTSSCTVVLSTYDHGELRATKLEGEVGEYIRIYAIPNMFYVTELVAVNGVNLIEENENTTGQYLFQLVAGENVVTASFVIDEELLGEMSTIVDQALSKDWTNLFSVENVIRIISFLLNGGILVAISRYFIKDKKLESKIENKIEEIMNKIIPDSTKSTVLATVEKFITPYFAQIESQFENLENAMTVFSRCLALAQENTPESKIAITQELSSLSLSDQVAISNVEKRLREFIEEQNKKMADLVAKLNNIQAVNSEIVNENTENVDTNSSDTEAEETNVDSVPYE